MTMSGHHNLLVELFVEELPPKSLKKLGDEFGALLLAGLRAQGLAGQHSALNVFASPRRLAARISHVAVRTQQPNACRLHDMLSNGQQHWVPVCRRIALR